MHDTVHGAEVTDLHLYLFLSVLPVCQFGLGSIIFSWLYATNILYYVVVYIEEC